MKNKIMRKVLALALVLAMLIGILPSGSWDSFAQNQVRATVENAEIVGTMGEIFLPQQEATINLENATFTGLSPGNVITSWFDVAVNVGIGAKVKTVTSNKIVVTFYATKDNNFPAGRYKGPVRVQIPASFIENAQEDLNVEENPEFIFNIGPEYITVEKNQPTKAAYGEGITENNEFTITLLQSSEVKFQSKNETDEDLSKSWFTGAPDGVTIKLKNPIENDAQTATFVIGGVSQEVGKHFIQPKIPANGFKNFPAELNGYLEPIAPIDIISVETYPKLTVGGAGIKGMVGEPLSANEVLVTVEGDTFKENPAGTWITNISDLGFTGQKIELLENRAKAKITLQGTPNKTRQETDLMMSVPSSNFEHYSQSDEASLIQVENNTVKIHITPYTPSLTDVIVTPVPVEKSKKAIPGTKVADVSVQGTPQDGIAYELEAGGADNDKFEISGSELKIKTAIAENTQYTVKVTAKQVGKEKNKVTKEIAFTPNLVDYMPTLTGINIAPVPVEHEKRDLVGTKLADLSVEGEPKNGIAYSLEGSDADNDKFQIEGAELRIKAGTTLEAKQYTVKLKAMETAKPENFVIKSISFDANVLPAPIKSASVSDVTVEGKKDQEIAEKELTITLAHETFKDFAAMESVNTWFKNLPAGLEAKVKQLDSTKKIVTLVITGTPTEVKKAVMEIRIPGAKLTGGSDLAVTRNENAKFEIAEKEQKQEEKKDEQSGNKHSIVNTDSSSNSGKAAEKDTNKAGTQSTVKTEVKVSGAKAEAKLAEKTVLDLIQKDRELAKKGLDVKVDAKASVEDVSVKLSEKTVKALTGTKTKEVRIDTPVAKVALDLGSLEAIQEAAKSDVELSIKKVDASKLSEAAQALVSGRPVLDLNVLSSSGKKVSEFGAGSVKVSVPYVLAKDEKAENLTVYYLPEEGAATEVAGAKYDAAKKAMVFETKHFSVYAVGEKPAKESMSKGFADAMNHWAKEQIDFVVSKGYMNGVSDESFAPDMPVTRGMFVTVLGRMAGMKDAKANDKFDDVSQDMYYAPYIAWAEEKGIVKGMGEKKFMPEAELTRE
ncbi:MAG: S-layer homology domain-containing protein, partial [Bacillota bacterium]|nr:S-layer homology domain-containing protein [Bacillota bacterium]